MSVDAPAKPLSIALVGNPNTGKSTLFSALCGVRQKTGNYPGVTVEKKHGQLTASGRKITLIDLPGTYSLAPRSPDEMVAVDVLLGRQKNETTPDGVLVIVDASNLERNLYIVSQIAELGLRTIVVLNMVDVATDRGMTIDVVQLEQRLGIPVVATQANRKEGFERLRSLLADFDQVPPAAIPSPFSELFQEKVDSLHAVLKKRQPELPKFLAERLLLDTSGYLADELHAHGHEVQPLIEEARTKLASAGTPVPAVEAIARYGWVQKMLDGVVARDTTARQSVTDRIDRVLTHRVMGPLVFAVVMFLMFQSIFSEWVAMALVGWIEATFEWLSGLAGNLLAEGPLLSLVQNGIIGGVGSVLVFLPQICILFLFIVVLEDCGYMARAAYLMDKLFSRFGLSGRSFIPLLSSFACAIPGIMAARVIENRRDRLITILIAPLMSCSARLPVYILLVAAFVPDRTYLGFIRSGTLTMLAMYALGVIAALMVALILRKTILRGETPPLVLELPTYKWPDITTVLSRVFDRAMAFIYRAGTLIFAVTVIVWAVSYFPRDEEAVEQPFAAEIAQLESQRESIAEKELPAEEAKVRLDEIDDRLTEIDNQIAGTHLRNSFLGQGGQWIEPVVQPLGWDWRIGAGVLASFPAREVVVGTLGVIYNLGEDEGEDSTSLREQLQNATWDGTDRKVFTLPVALSVMVFFALCAQCMATLAVIKRETNSWWWPLFTFTYMTVLAYVAAFVTYQVGTLILG